MIEPSQSHRRPFAGMHLGATYGAGDDLLARSNRGTTSKLEKRFYATLIAAGTYAVKGFGALHRWLHRISERCAATSQLLQFIALLLTFPCFKLSNFCFKVTFFLQKRHMRRLGFESP